MILFIQIWKHQICCLSFSFYFYLIAIHCDSFTWSIYFRVWIVYLFFIFLTQIFLVLRINDFHCQLRVGTKYTLKLSIQSFFFQITQDVVIYCLVVSIIQRFNYHIPWTNWNIILIFVHSLVIIAYLEYNGSFECCCIVFAFLSTYTHVNLLLYVTINRHIQFHRHNYVNSLKCFKYSHCNIL